MSASHESALRDVRRPDEGYDLARVRADFPMLSQKMRDKPLVYLDSASSAQKPRQVIEAVERFYTSSYANIHRGVYEISERATRAYESARDRVAHFISADSPREIVFTRSVTEAINLVAQSFGRSRLRAGDEILISTMEHHSNIVPWQMLCEQTGAVLQVAPIDDRGEIELDAMEGLMSDRTRLVAVGHVSNALGTINPVREIVELAQAREIPVLIDGAQAVPHMPVDVSELGCDFYGFTGHKLFGPTGIGVLYAKLSHLEQMPPYQGGGDMIASVSFEKTLYAEVPAKFEAGTPNIAGAIGLAAAIDYVTELGMERIAAWERELLDYATAALETVPGLRLIGTARNKAAILSFVLEGVHAHDIGTILDQQGIAIRTGHHCAQPVMDRYGVPATARASLSLYNTREEVDALVAGLERVREIFA
ncbi:MAG: cysteine desulfurase [Myxococcota bacterium]